MIVRMNFDFAAVSTNNMNGRNKNANRDYKNKDAKFFKTMLYAQLRQKYWQPIRELIEGGPSSNFEGIKNLKEPYGLVVDYIWYFPADDILLKPKSKTLHRHIKKRRFDVNNYDKWTTDCLFNYIGIDDSCIIDMNLKKRPTLSKEMHFEVIIRVELLEQIEEFRPFVILG